MFKQLMLLVKQLRDRNQGDPWILAQDFKSMAPLTVEEAYEFLDAVESGDPQAICDELGDLILHIFLYAQMASETDSFDINAIIQHALDKQQRRKLHFPHPSSISAEEALKRWDENKLAEKNKKSDSSTSILDDIAMHIPSMYRAMKLQQQVATVGFDWPDAVPIYDKISEELDEFKSAVIRNNKGHMEEELGDLLFSVINLARHYKINPDSALRRTNQKFTKRFQGIEKALTEQNKAITQCSLEELDALWEKMKV